MKWLGRLFRKLIRLAIITTVIVLLDAVLSPDSVDNGPAG